MKINVMSLEEANKVLENENNDYWISIRDYGFENLYDKVDKYMEQYPIKVLPLYFDDVTPYTVKHNLIHPFYKEQRAKRDLIYFNKEMAYSIIDFVEEALWSQPYSNKDNITLNIHCYAGKSRSQAIGMTLNTWFNIYINKKEKDYIKNLYMNLPDMMVNPYVFNIMNEACLKVMG